MSKRKAVSVLILGFFLSYGLYAQDIMDQYFEGDDLNRNIRNYIINVSNLIPDSPTLQNVWSYPPSSGVFFGAGLNASITILDRSKLVKNLTSDAGSFTATHDLAQFPTTIPYLPGTAFDIRAGVNRMDLGICGMWLDDNIVANYVGSFLGEGSHFTYRMGGVDLRYALVRDGERIFGLDYKYAQFIPAVTLQGGYYFTWLGFGIESGVNTEKVGVQFRNDTYMLAVQLSKSLPLLKPYFGAKAIFSKTDSAFEWETERPVALKGMEYPDGLQYKSGGEGGAVKGYFQFYGGLGLTFIFPHIITIGGAYNVVTRHFGINAAVRIIMGDLL
jgi:hypothetical protein